jgi:hypothetical protein
MAKSQKKIQEEVEILVAEEVTLAPKEEKEVVIEQPKTVKKPEKMVKVKMKDRHKCCIGGEWYYLEEGKQYNVPENVKEVLIKANKLLPL